MWASARASLAWRNCVRSRIVSALSSAFSTRITFPYRPLPNCRTHRITVPQPLTPYFRCTAKAQPWPLSTSLTTCILKASLYRITLMILGISHSKVPIYFRTGPQHPTSNIEPPRTALCSITGCWAFDVGCWMFCICEPLSPVLSRLVPRVASELAPCSSGACKTLPQSPSVCLNDGQLLPRLGSFLPFQGVPRVFRPLAPGVLNGSQMKQSILSLSGASQNH